MSLRQEIREGHHRGVMGALEREIERLYRRHRAIYDDLVVRAHGERGNPDYDMELYNRVLAVGAALTGDAKEALGRFIIKHPGI
jgi:hypothetical protein